MSKTVEESLWYAAASRAKAEGGILRRPGGTPHVVGDRRLEGHCLRDFAICQHFLMNFPGRLDQRRFVTPEAAVGFMLGTHALPTGWGNACPW